MKRVENMMKNILTEEQMKVKENLDEKLQQEIEPQSQLEELDDYLIMLAEMSNIGIHRKILLLEGYINKVKNKLKYKIMENLQIKITITDGEKDAKASINVEEYQKMKELHGVSLVDEIVNTLLNKIKDSITTNN